MNNNSSKSADSVWDEICPTENKEQSVLSLQEKNEMRYNIPLDLIQRRYLSGEVLRVLKKAGINDTKSFFENYEELIMVSRYKSKIERLYSYLKSFYDYNKIKGVILVTKEKINRSYKRSLLPKIRLALVALRLFKTAISKNISQIKKYFENEIGQDFHRKYMAIIFA